MPELFGYFLDNAIDVPSVVCHRKLRDHLFNKFQLELIYHHIPDQGIPDSSTSPAFIISSGSASNIGDGSLWHRPLIDYLEKKLAQQIPVLGICFTHQLMAHAWGAKVIHVTSAQDYHEGVRKINWQGDPSNSWVVSHAYQVVAPPPILKTLASTDLVMHEVLQHQTLPYLSIQAHPEASEDFIQYMTTKPRDEEAQKAMASGYRFIEQFLLKFVIGKGGKNPRT